ncbi:MAG TPA: DoxX family protein [Polyangiaceae bacterium]|jgi:hypothetical protein
MEAEKPGRARRVAFWALTIVIAWEMAAGSMWDLLQIPFTRSVFDRLGYPYYLLFILGAWKLPCALAWLAPRFPRLKEWAYAGGFFNYTGAAASHLLAHDKVSAAIGPAVFAAMTLGSWALRPPDRRLASAPPSEPTRPIMWAVPAAVIAGMVVVALLTLPKGVS